MQSRKGPFEPKPNQGWEIVAQFDDPEYGIWKLQRSSVSNGAWTGFKLISAAADPKKANYMLGWNGERLPNNRDVISLAEHRPELFKAVYETIKNLKRPKTCHTAPQTVSALPGHQEYPVCSLAAP